MYNIGHLFFSFHELLGLLYTISTQHKLVKVGKIEKGGKEPLPGEVQEGEILTWTLSLAQQEVSQQVCVGIAFCSQTALSSVGSGSPAKSLQVIAHLLNSKSRAQVGRGITEPEFQKLDMNLYGVKVLPLLGWVYNLCIGLEDILYIKTTTSSFISKVKFKESGEQVSRSL